MIAGELNVAASSTECTKLEPKAFFVAWRGVLTLAFSGFPAPLRALKTQLDAFPLRRENAGSKWPKMTLGAFSDHAKPLTKEQFEHLAQLCVQMSQNLSLLSDDFAVEKVSFVQFGSRSLESLLLRVDIPLRPASEKSSFNIEDDQREVVDKVLAESDDCDAYLLEINKPGNRATHYREAVSEATIVVFLGGNPNVVAILEQFRTAVDFLLPGYYTWFDNDSLHCTLRCV
ncbi:hypothetical protein BC830DRAFT_158833 [Chytriomyces sp. MP71]|nr:hypothetical protein BC830DRAFT_158833 [Chytriomyces sp. MP71]